MDSIPTAGFLRDARHAADRAGGTPLVVHLLAPNQRAVQTTTDLAGFWERLYPEVRRELMRRYPTARVAGAAMRVLIPGRKL